MSDNADFNLQPLNGGGSGAGGAEGGRGGFVALAVIAAAFGAGAAILLAPDEGAQTRRRVARGLRSFGGEAAGSLAQVQREIRRRRDQSRREKRVFALAGLLVGAGITALLTPESGTIDACGSPSERDRSSRRCRTSTTGCRQAPPKSSTSVKRRS